MNSFEDRFRVLLSLANTTQAKFCGKHSIAVSTVSTWKKGTMPFKEEQAQIIVNAFQKEKIHCTNEWLRTGVGEQPYVIGSGKKINIDIGTFQNDVFTEFKAFCANNAGGIVRECQQAFFPWIKLGDFAGMVPCTEIDREHGLYAIVNGEKKDILIVTDDIVKPTEGTLYKVLMIRKI